MKKIALFSDGTANSASNPNKTNVWRAYRALDCSGDSDQIAYYDNGVGTSSFTPTAIIGLAFGWGLASNVREIYGYLCRTYDPEDEIYGFGFSRGAFTMRVVVGLIASEGIIDRSKIRDNAEMDRWIAAAYKKFRRENFDPSMLSFLLRPLGKLITDTWHRLHRRRLYGAEKNISCPTGACEDYLVKFVGVWDTVDAYGLPIDELTRAWDKVIWPLTAKDNALSSRVERACHALALDEQRESFEPMLWDETTGDTNRLKQVWFPGVHANVGGGYPDDSLAYAPLKWILDESGLTYIRQIRREFDDQVDNNGPLYDSRGGIGNLYRYAPRDLERIYTERDMGLNQWIKSKKAQSASDSNSLSRDNKIKPKIHWSVFDRIRKSGDAYAPINLPKEYDVVDKNGGLVNFEPAELSLSEPFETPVQAAERRRQQTVVWNKVWARKLLYFVTLVALVVFICYPQIAAIKANGEPTGLAAFFEPILGTAGLGISAIPELIGKIPGLGFAAGWANRYQSFPFAFAIGLIGIGILLLWSMKINTALKGEMRSNWRHLVSPDKSSNSAGHMSKQVSSFRTQFAEFLLGPLYKNTVVTTIRRTLETGAVVVLLLLVIASCNRLILAVGDGFGALCTATPAISNPAFGEVFEFDPKNPCFNTGLELQKGKNYSIKFKVSENWSDANITADANGWRPNAAPAFISLATPIRRHLFADWYQPIARIDNKLFDRYPLVNSKLKSESKVVAEDKIKMQFKARRSGYLYLYVNDAVLLSPNMKTKGLEFYSNNIGTADVTVVELMEDAISK